MSVLAAPRRPPAGRAPKKKELKEAIEELQFVRNDMPVFKEKDSEVTPTWQLTMRNICPEFYRES